jgi:hypothetical protein
MPRLTILLFSTMLFACSQTARQDSKAIHPDSTADQLNQEYLSATYSQTTAIKPNSKCNIDTSVILTNQNLQHLINNLENISLTDYKTVNEIPNFIMDFLKCTRDSGQFSIANPGEDWQVGCTSVILVDKKGKVVSKPLPSRQLIYFGLGKDIALLTFYTGGIAKTEHTLIFQFQDKKVTDFWCGITWTGSADKKEIIKFLQANKDKDWGLNTNVIYF